MPSSFFAFQQGSDTRSRPPPGSDSLRYGRFRAYSPIPKRSVGIAVATGDALDGTPPSTPAGYGSINFATGNEEDEDIQGNDEPDERWWLDRMLISPRRRIVVKMVRRWWGRLGVLIFLPAVISIIWCAIPFPTSPLADDASLHPRPSKLSVASTTLNLADAIKNVFDFSILWDVICSWFHSLRDSVPMFPPSDGDKAGKEPGHGSSQVAINFWFFLVVYYGFYNLVGLIWITKIFNMYSLNWWPPRLGFRPTFTFFNFLPLTVGAVLYWYLPGPIIHQNLTWIFLTFSTMCCPLLIAFVVLLFERRHQNFGSWRGLTETQLLFTAYSPARGRYLNNNPRSRFRWRRLEGCFTLSRSFKRFLWFCSALFLSLIGYILGEAYAELYLRTLPHNSLETVIYVWSWVATIHTLDITTGWILGAKVGSYPLSFVFKLYFSLTYQTYVRALYARLRSPSQFAYLQLLSSSIVVVWSPISMTPIFHRVLVWLGLNGQEYADWKKTIGRSFFIRGLSENVSMVAWLGWVIVLHYGYNKKVYPYFSFEDKSDPYTFDLTFWASLATWACELAAGWIVRRIMVYGFDFHVTREAVHDFAAFPELLPACLALSLHVLQNMLFSIVRLRFYSQLNSL